MAPISKAQKAQDPWEGLWSFLKEELAPKPGRFAFTLHVAGLVCLTVLVSQTLRMPLVSYSAYIIFILSRTQINTTLLRASVAFVVVSLMICFVMGLYMLCAGEPALRIPILLGITFTGMYASRISPLGPVGVIMAFIGSFVLTLIDAVPSEAPVPSGDILTKTILWFWAAASLPISLVLGYHLLRIYTGFERLEADQKERPPLLVPDAFTNPLYTRYALKVTLAVFTAYFLYNMVDWPEIHTCVVTCFFVSLSNTQDSVRKMTQRVGGAMIGGGMGLLAIIFLMPHMTDIGHLLLMLGCWSIICAWIAAGSEKLSYMGMQMAFAFFFATLVGYGPTVELAMARDRVMGILLGNLIVFAIFSTIWPEGKERQDEA